MAAGVQYFFFFSVSAVLFLGTLSAFNPSNFKISILILQTFAGKKNLPMFINRSSTVLAEISQKSTHTSSRNRSDYGKSRFPALNEDKAFTNGQIFPTPNLRIFSLAELKSATRNFTGGTVLGEGDSDRVFKGWIDQKIPGNSATGTVIAVRILTTESLQKSQEWQVIRVYLTTD